MTNSMIKKGSTEMITNKIEKYNLDKIFNISLSLNAQEVS